MRNIVLAIFVLKCLGQRLEASEIAASSLVLPSERIQTSSTSQPKDESSTGLEPDPFAANLYRRIGGIPTMSYEELRACYRNAVKIWHPNSNFDPSRRKYKGRQIRADEFEEAAKRLSDAWEILDNSEKRAKYDSGFRAKFDFSKGVTAEEIFQSISAFDDPFVQTNMIWLIARSGRGRPEVKEALRLILKNTNGKFSGVSQGFAFVPRWAAGDILLEFYGDEIAVGWVQDTINSASYDILENRQLVSKLIESLAKNKKGFNFLYSFASRYTGCLFFTNILSLGDSYIGTRAIEALYFFISTDRETEESKTSFNIAQTILYHPKREGPRLGILRAAAIKIMGKMVSYRTDAKQFIRTEIMRPIWAHEGDESSRKAAAIEGLNLDIQDQEVEAALRIEAQRLNQMYWTVPLAAINAMPTLLLESDILRKVEETANFSFHHRNAHLIARDILKKYRPKIECIQATLRLSKDRR
jgi:curved DNA-binding protein CbpA